MKKAILAALFLVTNMQAAGSLTPEEEEAAKILSGLKAQKNATPASESNLNPSTTEIQPTTNPGQNKKTTKCIFCNKIFLTDINLAQHLKKHDPSEYTTACYNRSRGCFRLFRNQEGAAVHGAYCPKKPY